MIAFGDHSKSRDHALPGREIWKYNLNIFKDMSVQAGTKGSKRSATAMLGTPASASAISASGGQHKKKARTGVVRDSPQLADLLIDSVGQSSSSSSAGKSSSSSASGRCSSSSSAEVLDLFSASQPPNIATILYERSRGVSAIAPAQNPSISFNRNRLPPSAPTQRDSQEFPEEDTASADNAADTDSSEDGELDNVQAYLDEVDDADRYADYAQNYTPVAEMDIVAAAPAAAAIEDAGYPDFINQVIVWEDDDVHHDPIEEALLHMAGKKNEARLFESMFVLSCCVVADDVCRNMDTQRKDLYHTSLVDTFFDHQTTYSVKAYQQTYLFTHLAGNSWPAGYKQWWEQEYNKADKNKVDLTSGIRWFLNNGPGTRKRRRNFLYATVSSTSMSGSTTNCPHTVCQ